MQAAQMGLCLSKNYYCWAVEHSKLLNGKGIVWEMQQHNSAKIGKSRDYLPLVVVMAHHIFAQIYSLVVLFIPAG
jgi:hypothetical protein